MNHDMTELTKRLKEQGAIVVTGRRSGHFCVTHPSGQKFFLASTPRGGKRSMQNARALLKRGGFDL